MYKGLVFTVATAFLLMAAVFSATVGAFVSVGVNKGDWIEYNVEIRLTEPARTDVSVSSDHNVTWARMEITEVQGAILSLNIQTRLSNGTIIPENITLNIEAGELGDDFIIPANLEIGDSFFDIHQGNITITDVAQSTVAGVQRTVISAATNETCYTWDQAKGILLNAKTTLPDYTLATTTNKTSLWQSPATTASPDGTPHSAPQTPEPNLATTYTIIIGVIVILISIGAVIALLRRSGKSGKP